jgi:nicotinamide-nucleotide amidase
MRARPRGPTDAQLARLALRVGRWLQRGEVRLTAAESCTGGWIAKVLTDVAGSSEWFGEGFVTYSNAAKQARLGVSAAVLRRHGAVSRAVAQAMARGALERARRVDPTTCLAVAVTGIAGPGGGVAGKPVGTVWFCWARAGRGRRGGRGRIRVRAEVRRFRGDRETVRRKTVRHALRGLLEPSG